MLTLSVTLRRASSAGHVSCPWRRGWNGSPIFPDAPLGGQHHGQAALCCGPLLTHRHFRSPRNKAVGVLGARARVCSHLVMWGGLTVPPLPDASTTSAWPCITACIGQQSSGSEARQFDLAEATFCFSFINKLQFINLENKGD